MEGEEVHDAEDCVSSAGHPVDVSQSSGVMSLSGIKLADISITSDITDSEIENEDTILGTSVCKGLKIDTQCSTQAAAVVASVFSISPTDNSRSISFPKKPDERRSKTENTANAFRDTDKLSTSVAVSSSQCDTANVKLVSDFSYYTVPFAENEVVSSVNKLSADNLKLVLQENSTLLSDKQLLHDIFRALDEKFGQDSTADCTSHISSEKYSQSFVPPNRDPGPSLRWKSNSSDGILTQDVASADSDMQLTCDPLYAQNYQISSTSSIPLSSASCISSNQRYFKNYFFSSGSHDCVRSQEESDSHIGHSNMREIPQQPSNGLLTSNLEKGVAATDPQEESIGDKNSEKHVKFQQSPMEELTLKPATRDGNHTLSQQHSVNLLEDLPCATLTEKILNKLSGLRWKLMGWEDVGARPPFDDRSSLTFIHQLLNMLQVHQLEKKHLEDEILTTKAMLKKMSDEAYVRQSMYDKREVRLLEADSQLGIIQKEWVGAQEMMKREIIRLAAQCKQLKEEKGSLKDEADAMRKDINKLMQSVWDYEKIKNALENTQDELAASRRQTAEIAEENSRLNQVLQEKRRCLQELEEVRLPEMHQELKVVKNKTCGLEEAHEKLIRTNAHLEDDLHILQEQHRILLGKVVDEEDMKNKAFKEKVSLEEQVKDLSSKVTATRNELHHHYQAQLEDLMGKKSQSLQEQLSKLELNMKRNLEEQLDAQRRSHHYACLSLQKGHEKKIQELNSSHGTQILELEQQLMLLKEENMRLKDERQGIITAVSSILGLHHKDTFNVQEPSSRPEGIHCEEQNKNFRWKMFSRPTSGGSSRGKSLSKSSSRPASGKSARGVPHLGLRSSSSSDSDATVFQEGRQTVRCLVGGPLQKLPNNANVENGNISKLGNSGSDTMAGLLESDYHYRNSHVDNSEREYRSLPDLQSKSNFISNQPSRAPTMSWSQICQNQEFRDENSKLRGKAANESTKKNHGNIGHQDAPNGSVYPSFTKKIIKASEILQASDITDDDGGEMSALSELQVDQEMSRMLQELKMKVKSARPSDSEAPTHDTSFDQDPASITLHKLSQVSTVLSQYVTQSP